MMRADGIDESAPAFHLRNDVRTGVDRRQRARLRVQQREQSPACHAEAERVRMEVRVAHVHDDATARGFAVQSSDDGAAGECRIAQAECIKYAEAGWLQQEAGADRAQFGVALEHLDRMPGAREEDRGGLPGGALTDDRDPHACPPPPPHCSGAPEVPEERRWPRRCERVSMRSLKRGCWREPAERVPSNLIRSVPV